MMMYGYRLKKEEHSRNDLITAHAKYACHLEVRLKKENFFERQLTRSSIKNHQSRSAEIERSRRITTTDLDTTAWQWWKEKKPTYKINDKKGKPKRTQFTINRIFQQRHASDNNSCLFNAVINNIIHTIKNGLALPEKFQQAFSVGLGTNMLTRKHQQHPLQNTLDQINTFSQFVKTVRQGQVNDKDLETIGNAVLRQMVINAHTELALSESPSGQHIKRAYELSKFTNRLQGEDVDLAALQETTDLPFEIYEECENNKIHLNVFLATNNQPDQTTIRLIHITCMSGKEHLNHYDWLQVIANPQAIAARQADSEEAQIENDYNSTTYAPDEASGLATTRALFQKEISSGTNGRHQNLLDSHIHAITYALSTHVAQQEYLAVAAANRENSDGAQVLSSHRQAFVNGKAESNPRKHSPNDSPNSSLTLP